jgi:hypothetical protein
VHEIESEMEPKEEEPEVPLGQFFAIPTASYLRKVVIKRGEDGKQNSANDDVVEVGNDEIGITQLPVER